MMNERKKLLVAIVATVLICQPLAMRGRVYDRTHWVHTMLRIADPVLTHLSENTLRRDMPVETVPGADRKGVTHLEAFGRTLCGIAPWLNLPPDNTPEGRLRAHYTDLVVRCLQNAVNPASPDYMPFDRPGGQPLVDAAFLAQGLLRSKDRIWPKLDTLTQHRLIREMKASRRIKAYECNWLLFSATIEAALLEFTGECDMKPVNYALDRHKQWYKGDSWYGDGPNMQTNYYNSYVIQPMLVDVTRILRDHGITGSIDYPTALKRMVRFAVIEENLISPEGTFPVLGRSSGYRFASMQVLAQTALMKQLPSYIVPAQVRCALTKIIKRQTGSGNFDRQGWLTLGFCGHQPKIADSYVSTGSCYMCTVVFLPLGLPATDSFWTGAPAKWSSQKIWSGETDIVCPHAVNY